MKKRSNPFGYKARQSLHFLVARGSFNAIKVLLSRGFLVTGTDIFGRTLLHIATLKGDKRMIQLLLNYSAKLDCRDYKGQTPLHLAIAAGDLKIIKLFLNAPQFEKNIIEFRNYKEQTPLYLAAMYGYINILKLLIKHGAKTDVKIRGYITPLQIAVFANKPRCVKELLKSLGNINVFNIEEDGKIISTAIAKHFFSNRNSNSNVHSCTDHNFKFSKYKQLKCVEIIDLLLDAGAKFHDNDLTTNALHYATMLNGYFIVKKLLESGIKVNATDSIGRTALHIACKSSCAKVVRILLNFGADVTKTFEHGVLPIHFMASTKNRKILSMLLHAGADINGRTNLGHTLFDYILSYEPEDVSFIYTILRHGIDIHVKSQHDQTALHWMSNFYGYNCAGILFDFVLDFNIVNAFNETPLKYCTLRNMPVASIEFIIKAMVKMEQDKKFKISDLNMSVISENYLDLYENCKKELENLKKQEFWGRIKFYELLNISLEKLKGYTRNLKLMQVFHSGACNSFPLYGDLMKYRMLFALRLNDIHEKCVDVLNQLVFSERLPLGICYEILSFLSLEDMEKLSKM